jgi:predicted transcriptional regulator of viral defense system
VVCLLSALQIYNVTTQSPHRVWIAIDNKAKPPKVGRLPVKFIYMSGAALRSGIETMKFEGVQVRVFSLAKTVADCFKFRNKVGLDVAIEALREVYRKRLVTSDELWRYAKICRVSKVMRPYMEAMV